MDGLNSEERRRREEYLEGARENFCAICKMEWSGQWWNHCRLKRHTQAVAEAQGT